MRTANQTVISSSSSSSCSGRIRFDSCSLYPQNEIGPSISSSVVLCVPRPFGLYYSACLGILFVSILCMCCSHFSWSCFISFTIFSLLFFFPNTLVFFLYLVLLFQEGVSKISSVLLLNVVPLFSSVPRLHSNCYFCTENSTRKNGYNTYRGRTQTEYQNKRYNINQKDGGTEDDRGRDGGTNFILGIKEQETRPILHEHDDFYTVGSS